MRKILLGFAILSIATLLYLSCTKANKKETEFNDLLRPVTGNVLEMAKNKNIENRVPAGCGCQAHGGVLISNIVHYMATCRTNCDRGIGFRCGTAGFYICNDGTVVLCPMGHCPAPDPTRMMKSYITFYDNGTIKLQFQYPVPDTEIDNIVFEVEEDETVGIPEEILIGARQYDSFVVKKGNYYINYSDGPYGSVILNAELKE